jgi:hypothetical protein
MDALRHRKRVEPVTGLLFATAFSRSFASCLREYQRVHACQVTAGWLCHFTQEESERAIGFVRCFAA